MKNQKLVRYRLSSYASQYINVLKLTLDKLDKLDKLDTVLLSSFGGKGKKDNKEGMMDTYRLRQEDKSFTLENIIHRWAPPEDGNDTSAYVRTVIRLMDYKVGGREVLPSPTCKQGHKKLTRILAAMTCVECDIKPDEVDRKSIEQGWRMAF